MPQPRSLLIKGLILFFIVPFIKACSGKSLLSLYYLPIEEQSVFKLLLLLPIGALLVTFMRLIIGVRTSGTFMPVLILLAFLQISLLPGRAGFLLIVSLGLVWTKIAARCCWN